MSRILLVVAGTAIYLAIGALGAAYLAGALYFVFNKSMPHDLAFDTWFRFWNAYAADPVQHHRLALSGVGGVAPIVALPVIALLALAQGDRSLHGDARWATAAEIREAGLL